MEVWYINNYFGCFDCFSPGRGCVRHLIMSGTFGVDDLFRVNIMLVQEFENNGKLGVDSKDDTHIFQGVG